MQGTYQCLQAVKNFMFLGYLPLTVPCTNLLSTAFGNFPLEFTAGLIIVIFPVQVIKVGLPCIDAEFCGFLLLWVEFGVPIFAVEGTHFVVG